MEKHLEFLEASVWTLPAVRKKAGREHRVPLSPLAVAALAKLPRNTYRNFLSAGALARSQ